MRYRKRRVGETALTAPPAARSIMNRIVEKLLAIERRCFPTPLDEGFRSLFAEVLDLVEHYQRELVARSGYTVSCAPGCTDCCCHWVEDVNSFEAEIIADYLRTTMPGRIDAVLQKCSADCREIERLEKLVAMKLQEQRIAPGNPAVDTVDLLLAVFYRIRRPCPLLGDDGRCSIYEVRPLTCRIYVSFSDPLRCNPEYIDSSVVPTCLIDLSESANRVLDALHFSYLRFDGDTGLRSLMVKYLSDDQT
ncbi:MAG: YkgJ family cysteine cluster protein [Chitinispirillaceae bacterium]|nr:YkgJ family cysteine cluster protein [Chitinispirillaceae bacterium]